MVSIFPAEDDESTTTHTGWRESFRHVIQPGSRFDYCVLAVIITNSILTACKDYENLDGNFEPINVGRNAVINSLENIFLILFVLECALKIAVMGCFGDKSSYFRDGWCIFDFIIVMTSIISIVPKIPNLTALRNLRVLRPLRSISKLPRLRKMIRALSASVIDILNAIFLLLFILACFSTMGVLMWKGIMHGRCRMTPYPIIMPLNCRMTKDACWDEYISNALLEPSKYRCTSENNDSDQWEQHTSPWFLDGPFDCIWPLDHQDSRLCDLTLKFRKCSSGRTCGADYDRFGNPRFLNTFEPYGVPRMNVAHYNEAFNWGLTGFDSFSQAMITMFQIVSLEGWSSIFYHISDVWYKFPAFIIFCCQIVMCGYIIMNLVLAIISKSIDTLQSDEQKLLGSNIHENEIQSNVDDTSDAYANERESRNFLGHLIGTMSHSMLIDICVFCNAIILCVDYYGISSTQVALYECLNIMFAAVFLVDAILCNSYYGFAYWKNPSTRFDGTLAVLSLIEIVFYVLPKTMSGSFSVFRALRLFRLLKLAKSWKSFQSLLGTITISFPEVGNFGALLFIVIYVFSLLGMQLLAKRLRFDSRTGAVVSARELERVDIPRSNFDTFYSSMVSVFQILTGEDWNTIMYDVWRARGRIAVIFVVIVIIIGKLVIMNLFLAVLLKYFQVNDEFGRLTSQNGSAHSESKVSVQTDDRPYYINLLCVTVSKDNWLRKISFKLVKNWKFDGFVSFMIVISSLCLLIDNPLADPDLFHIRVLKILDNGFTIIFMMECGAKILAYGLIIEKMSYFRSGWNILDFLLVITSVLNFVNVGPGNAFRSLRTLRVLRPLRMISRFEELKVVVDALLFALPAVRDVGILCLLILIIFSCFGVSFLKGTFYGCSGEMFNRFTDIEVSVMTFPEKYHLLSDANIISLHNYRGNCTSLWSDGILPSSMDVCKCFGAEWTRSVHQNFDNVVNGMALLFEISSTEGWVKVMNAAIDQRGVHMQPVRDSQKLWSLFFVSFILIYSFFLLELFVGVVLNNFSRIKEKNGSGLMTETQKNWAKTQAFLLRIRPVTKPMKPSNIWRSKCYHISYGTGASKFDLIITCVVLLAVIAISARSYGDSKFKMTFLLLLSNAFRVLFILEAAIKLFAVGYSYFSDNWNRYDFSLIIVATFGWLIDERISALGCLFRLFRALKHTRKLRKLCFTLLILLPSIANIVGLIVLIFFVYAILGVQLFCFLPEKGELTQSANFRTFGNAMLLLFRFATGENWNGFMRDMAISVEDCHDDQIFDRQMPWCINDHELPNCTPLRGCGAGILTYLYFYSFVLFVSFVVMNLFVGAVIEAFEMSFEEGELTSETLNEFLGAWSIFDTKGSGFISAMDFKNLVMLMKPPLGVGGGLTSYMEANQIISHPCLQSLPITKDGKVNIVHVVTHLTKRKMIEEIGNDFVDLDENHPLQLRLKAMTESDRTLNELYIEKSKKKLRVLRAFARAKIKREDLFPTV